MKLKTLQTFAFLTLLALATASGAQTAAKIGFVSLDRILRDAAPAVRAQKKIEAEFSKRDKDLQRTAEQLKQMQQDMERNSVTMSDSERQRREREFAEATRDFQRRQREFREDLNQRRNEELATVLERANRAVRKIAEDEKYDVILQEAVYANPRIDITEKVIKALDEAMPAK
jgi:outer membrane protein